LGLHKEASIRIEQTPTAGIEREQALAVGRPFQQLGRRSRRGSPEHLLRIRVNELDATIRGGEGDQVGAGSAWARAKGGWPNRLPGWCDASDARLDPPITRSVTSDNP
jgi:hypothetical protein